MNYYEMRRRTMNLVTDKVSQGLSNEEIFHLALVKYGASKKMVKEMIEAVEGIMKKNVREKIAKRDNKHNPGKLDKRASKK